MKIGLYSSDVNPSLNDEPGPLELNDADLATFDRREVELDEETAAEHAAEVEDAEDEPDEKPRRPVVSRRGWKPLTQSEELTLIARVQKREPRAADKLCEQFRPFLLGLLGKRYRGDPLSFEEKLYAAQEGLVRAAQKFDPDKGLRLSTYARHWILAKINELTTQTCGSVVKCGNREENLERPGDESFDAVIGDGDESYTLHDTICDDDDNHDAPDIERHDAMAAAIYVALDDRQRKIFIARNLTDNRPSLNELGRQFGITGERVRQIDGAAKEKVAQQSFKALPASLQRDPAERAFTARNITANAFGSGHCTRGNGKSRAEIHHRIQMYILCDRVVAFAEKLGRRPAAEEIAARELTSIVAARECLEALASGKVEVPRYIVERAKRRNEWPSANILVRPEKPPPCDSTPRLSAIRDGVLTSKLPAATQPAINIEQPAAVRKPRSSRRPGNNGRIRVWRSSETRVSA